MTNFAELNLYHTCVIYLSRNAGLESCTYIHLNNIQKYIEPFRHVQAAFWGQFRRVSENEKKISTLQNVMWHGVSWTMLLHSMAQKRTISGKKLLNSSYLSAPYWVAVWCSSSIVIQSGKGMQRTQYCMRYRRDSRSVQTLLTSLKQSFISINNGRTMYFVPLCTLEIHAYLYMGVCVCVFVCVADKCWLNGLLKLQFVHDVTHRYTSGPFFLIYTRTEISWTNDQTNEEKPSKIVLIWWKLRKN